MRNYEIEAAWRYHNGTKHPNGVLLDRFHVYHPTFRPTPYKIYKDTPQVNLLLDRNPIGVSVLDAISNLVLNKNTILDLATLTRVLYFSSGVTKKIKFPDPLGVVDFRAASCTGALYHIETYVICSDIPGLDAGVYHFDPNGMKLNLIRDGDFRNFALSLTADDSFVSQAPIILVFTDVFSRNSIKYQSREYRHAFWDGGTILANILAISTAHRIPSKIITGFIDSQLSQLLGLDINKEAPIVLLPLGKTENKIPSSPPLSEINLDTVSSDYESDYAEINAMHESSCLFDAQEVSSWKKPMATVEKSHGELIHLGKNINVQESLEQTIIRRGSTRRFSFESIAFEQLSTILNQTTTGINADFVNHESLLSDMYIIVNAVEGLDSGSYYYVREKNSLELLRKGNFRHVSGNLGLDQDLPHDASVTIFFLTELKKILKHFGNRGYRVAQLDAAITGGKIYLAAYALDLGATGHL